MLEEPCVTVEQFAALFTPFRLLKPVCNQRVFSVRVFVFAVLNEVRVPFVTKSTRLSFFRMMD